MESAVYRVLLTVLLYTSLVSPAPQDASSITYVKPLSDDPPGTPGPPARESRIENLPLVIGGVTESDSLASDERNDASSDYQADSSANSTQRFTREDSTTASYEDTTAITERSSDEVTEPQKAKPRYQSPRFISKLSYFQKSNYEESGLTNLLERTGKRKFRSRCRCEKIWNCPKLQITVPRCPEEYFMCCF